jgi:hypothetical protein
LPPLGHCKTGTGAVDCLCGWQVGPRSGGDFLLGGWPEKQYRSALNQVTALCAQDGRIWFPTARGLSVVDPNLSPEPAVQAIIDSVVVDDREQAPGEISVAPGQHRITFAYTTPPTAAPERIRFRYRLSGWDRNWIDADTAREVSYTALPPGSYTFEVYRGESPGRGKCAAGRNSHESPTVLLADEMVYRPGCIWGRSYTCRGNSTPHTDERGASERSLSGVRHGARAHRLPDSRHCDSGYDRNRFVARAAWVSDYRSA